MATIYKVAEHAGVSLSTVSRVLNGRKTVNPELREKVEKAVKELNYRPSSVARSLATNRSDSIGVLVSELATPFFGEMMQAIEATLRMANKHVIITVGHNDKEQEEDAIEFLISRNCDALIMQSEGMTDQQLVDIAKDRLPIAVINRFVPGLDGNTCFGLDNKLGGKMATQHLIDNGHTSIAYISGPERKVDAMERLAGHKQALQEASINIDDDLIYEGNFREQNGIDGLQTLLSIGKKFTGLVCANDWMASGAMTCARDMGIKLPDDLSIVGFDDIVFAHHVYPKLTTISNPVYKMGEMAAKSILNRLYGEKHKLNEMYSPVLIERDSVLNIVE